MSVYHASVGKHTQTSIYAFPDNYSQTDSQAFCPEVGSHGHEGLPLTSSVPEMVMRDQVAALDTCSEWWQYRCYLVALHFPL